MSPEQKRAYMLFQWHWARNGLGGSRARPDWLGWLASLSADTDLGISLLNQAVVGPPRTWEWSYVSGEDATRAAQTVTDPVAFARMQYDWLEQDLTGASYLTGLRGRDLARAWLDVSGGDRFGRMAGVAIARSLFETGLEAFRVSSLLIDTLKQAPQSADTLINIGDGIWVHLFRYIGGEKTNYVSVRERTRNTLTNIKWLRGAEATRKVAESYDVASEFLHQGVAEAAETKHQVEAAELLLLATGASGTLQSFQNFKVASRLAESIAERVHDGPYTQMCALGVDENIPEKPSVEPPSWAQSFKRE